MSKAAQRNSALSAVSRAASKCGLSACVGRTQADHVKPHTAGLTTGPFVGRDASPPAPIAEHQRRQWRVGDPVRDIESTRAPVNKGEAKDDQLPWDRPEAEPEAEAETHVIEVQTLQKQLGEATRQKAEAQTKCSLLEQKFRDEHCVLQQHLAEREVELMREVSRANSKAESFAEEASAKSAENAKLQQELRELREETLKLRMQRHESRLHAEAKLRDISQRLNAAQEETRLVKHSEETVKQQFLALQEQVQLSPRNLHHELATRAPHAFAQAEDSDVDGCSWARLGRVAIKPDVELSPLWRARSPVPDSVPDEHDDIETDAETAVFEEEVCAPMPVPSSASVKAMAPSAPLAARTAPPIKASPPPLLARAIPVSPMGRANVSNRITSLASPEQMWQVREFREHSAPLPSASPRTGTLTSPEAGQGYRELTAPLPYRELSSTAPSVPVNLVRSSPTVGASPNTSLRSRWAASSSTTDRVYKAPPLGFPASGAGSFSVGVGRPSTSSLPLMGSARCYPGGRKTSIPGLNGASNTSIPSPPSSARTPGVQSLHFLLQSSGRNQTVSC